MEIKTIAGGFWVPDDSHIGKWQIETQKLDHAPWLSDLCCKYIPEGGIVVDAGAFDGDFTKPFCERVGERGTVLALEPGEVAFKCLEENVLNFQFKNVTAIKFGLGDKRQTVSFHENENLGASTCSEDPQGEIVVRLLDEIIALYEFQKVDFIKFDIEGWEHKALLGGAQCIKKFRPAMLLEMNKGALANQGSTYERITDLLEEWGYKWAIAQPNCVYTDPQWDLLALPISKLK